MNETEIEDSDQVLTLFYWEQSTNLNDKDTLNFKHFKQQNSWDSLHKEVSGVRNCDIFSLTHTPKNIG